MLIQGVGLPITGVNFLLCNSEIFACVLLLTRHTLIYMDT